MRGVERKNQRRQCGCRSGGRLKDEGIKTAVRMKDLFFENNGGEGVRVDGSTPGSGPVIDFYDRGGKEARREIRKDSRQDSES